MSGLSFEIVGDNTNLMRKLEETERAIKNTSKSIEREGGSIDNLFGRLTKAAAAFSAGLSVKEIGQNIIKVRGEFQQLEVAFTTMLGSKEAADRLMSQMVETAATTPFDLQSVANGARQLIAYGTAADDVNETLVRLGNIAAGLSIPLNDLVYLYGTTMTQGRLYTEDLNQFTGRGIPMIRELSEVLGVAEDEVKGLVEEGRVGFPEVQKVIQNLTNEGGMFFNLMSEQSKTITGQISNIKDSFSQMFNEIGKQNEGIINEALSGISYLVENYESVGKSIVEMAAAYGSYKAILITITGLQKAYSIVLQQSIVEKNLAAAAGITLSNAEALAASRTKLLQTAQAALNKTMLANPYVLAAAAVTALGYGIYKLITYQTEFEKGQDRLNNALNESSKASLSEQRELARLKGELSSLTKGTDEYNSVKDKIVKGYSKYYSGLEEEINKVGLTEEAYNRLTEAINKSFGARQYDKFKTEQENVLDELMSNNLGKIQNELYKNLGDEEGSRIYTQIRQAILEQREIDDELQYTLDEIQNKGTILANSRIDNYIRNIQEAQNATEELDKLAKERFGVDGSAPNIATGTGKENNDSEKENKNLQQIIQSIQEAEKNLASLRLQSQKGLIDTSEVESAEKEIKGLKDTFATMTGKEYGKEDKSLKEEIKKRKELAEELIQVRLQNQQDEINLMEDGAEKRMRQLELDYQKEYAEISAIRNKWQEANGGTLTQEQSIEINTRYSNAEQKYNTGLSLIDKEQADEEAHAMNDYLLEYGTFQEKKMALAVKYSNLIAEASTEGEKLSLGKEWDKELTDLEIKAGNTSNAIISLFGDMSNKSLDELEELAARGQEALEFIQGGEWDTATGMKLGITEDEFRRWQESPELIKQAGDALKEVKGQSDALQPSFVKVSDGIKQFFNSGNDAKKLQEALGLINEGVNEIMSSVGFLSDVFGTLGDSFGGAFSGIAEGMGVAMNAVNAGLQGMQAGSMFGPIGASAGAAIGVVSSLASAIAKIHDKKNEQRIQRLQDQIDVLDSSYNNLGRSIEKAYSTDASKLIDQQNELLEQQKLLIQQQIMEEEDKKKTDDDRIKQWQQQIEDIDNQIKDNAEQAQEAIAGISFDTFRNNFLETLSDFDSTAEDFAEDFEGYLQSAILNSLLASKYDKKIKQLYNRWTELGEDGLSQSEVEKLRAEQQAIVEQMLSDRDNLASIFGWGGSEEGASSNPQEASTGGFDSMSQDQASELNGRFSALQMSGEEIKRAMIQVLTNINLLVVSMDEMTVVVSEIRDMVRTSTGHLEDISTYSKKILDGFGKKLDEMNNTLKMAI